MPTLFIERQRGSIVDRFRPYPVLIDGVRRGELKEGGKGSFNVGHGIHTVHFASDPAGAMSHTVHVGEAGSTISCRSNMRRLLEQLAIFPPDSGLETFVREDSCLAMLAPAAH